MPEIRYTKDHEWVSLDGTVATVGITAHAQEALGDIVFVELPESGRTVAQGDSAAVVESVKAASEVYAPLSGTVTETNAPLVADPASLAGTAEEAGWFFRMEITDRAEFDALMDRAGYDAMVEAH